MESSAPMSSLRRLGLTLFLIGVVALTTGLQFASCAVGGKWQHRLQAFAESDQVQLYARSITPYGKERFLSREIEGKIAAFDFVEQTSASLSVYLYDPAKKCPPCRCGTITGLDPKAEHFLRPWLDDDSESGLGPRDIWVQEDSDLDPGDTVTIAGEEFQVTARNGYPYHFSFESYRNCYVRLDALDDLASNTTEEWKGCLGDTPGLITLVLIKLKPPDKGGVSADEAKKILEGSIGEIGISKYPDPPGKWAVHVRAAIIAARVLAWLLWPGMMLCFAGVFSRFQRTNPRKGIGREMLKGAVLALIGAAIGLVFNDPLQSLMINRVIHEMQLAGASLQLQDPSLFGYLPLTTLSDIIPPLIYVPILAILLTLASIMISNWLSRRSEGKGVPES